MKKTLVSLIAGISLVASNPVFAGDLKVGDKMPEPRGRYIFIEMKEDLNLNDKFVREYHGKGLISSLNFRHLLMPYRKREDTSPNPFDYELLVINEFNKIYKRMVLLSDPEKKDAYEIYQDCSPDGLIDSIRRMKFDYNSVPNLNDLKFSCDIITLTDFPPVENPQETDQVVYVFK